MAQSDASAWLDKFQEFVHYCLPAIQISPTITVSSLVAVVVGLALAFRSNKLLRPMVTAMGVVVGIWIGIRLAAFVGTPAPITAAIGAVVVAAVAFKTYRIWLVMGSIVTLFFIATTYQLGQGDLTRYLPAPAKNYIERVELPTAQEQHKNLHTEKWAHLENVGQRINEELRNLGPRGWLLPALAAIVGGVLAWKALNLFAIAWMSLLGAVTAVIGGATFVSSYWPDTRTSLTANPHVLAGVMIGLWLLGLIYQAKEARLPKSKAPPPKVESPKS